MKKRIFFDGYFEIFFAIIKNSLFSGLCALFREGVNLEVMSADNILEEMRVDKILATDDEKIKYYVTKRHAWKGRFLKNVVSL